MKNVSTMSLEEVSQEIAEVTPKLQKAFEEGGYTPGGALDMSKVTVFGDGDDRFKSQQLTTMNLRLNDLGARRKAITDADAAKAAADEADAWLRSPRDPAPPIGGKAGYSDFATQLMKDADTWAKSAIGKRTGNPAAIPLDVKTFIEREMKTVMSTGAGYAPQAIRTGIVVPAAYQMPAVIDLVPIVRTNQSAFVFMRQTTRTNAAAEIAESVQGTLASAAESAFAWTEISETIRKINTFIPVTDEQLEDIEGIEDLLRRDLILGIRQRLSDQILDGDGTAPNIEGLLDAGRDTTDVDTAGKFIADAIADLIRTCFTTGFVQADAIVMHPTDWWGYRTATTLDGLYIAGNPNENLRPAMWGLPVVPTTEIAQGTALAGDFGGFTRLAVKRDIEVQISSEHASYFIQGVKAIKAEMRATLAVLRETAFSKTDDIVVS